VCECDPIPLNSNGMDCGNTFVCLSYVTENSANQEIS